MYYVTTDYQQVMDEPWREVYLTAGKLYPAKLAEGYTDIYDILDDSGYAISVSVNRPTAHLNDEGVFKLYKLEQVLEYSDLQVFYSLETAVEMREEEIAESERRNSLYNSAIGKLTKEEREVLGV